jgi:transcriptional regulator with XRE-family HTH domain
MEMELNKEALKNQRDCRAWSQTQLAVVSGLSIRTIQRIEKTGVASQESAKSLASVYECSITELVTKNISSQIKNPFSFSKISSKAKVIHICILFPVLSIAFYLFWTGHNSINWVDLFRDSIFSHTISEVRLEKISFLILVLVVGLPSLIPGFLYDFINKKVHFNDNMANKVFKQD